MGGSHTQESMGQITAPSARVTPNGWLVVRESTPECFIQVLEFWSFAQIYTYIVQLLFSKKIGKTKYKVFKKWCAETVP